MAYHKKKKSAKNGDKKQIKWRIGDLIQYNSDPEDENDKSDTLSTRQGVIVEYKEENKQISIKRSDDAQIHNYCINDINMIYNITHKGHPKPTTGALIKHHKEIYNDQFSDLKAKIKEDRNNKDKESMKENKAKLKDLKLKQKTERNEIKRQTAALKKHYDPSKDKYDNQHIEEKDCWEYRLPNMQQFIINISNKEFKHKTDKKLRNILSDYKDKKCISSSQALSKITDWIDDRMPNALAYTTKPKDMSKIISNLSNNIIDILGLILADKEFCLEICDRSYHHDLFEKMVIMKGKKGWKLRLHLFTSEGLKEIQEELHSHRNHFLSTCLYGSITQKVWEIVDDKDDKDKKDNKEKKDENNEEEEEENGGVDDNKKKKENKEKKEEKNEDEIVTLHKYTYDPKGDEKNREFNIVKHPEKVQLKCVKIQTSKVDDMYYMHPSIIHGVVQCEGKTITLVLNTKTVMKKSCFGSQQQWHSQQFKRQKFKMNELNDILSMAIKLIKSNDE